jgi:hypothetical protein
MYIFSLLIFIIEMNWIISNITIIDGIITIKGYNPVTKLILNSRIEKILISQLPDDITSNEHIAISFVSFDQAYKITVEYEENINEYNNRIARPSESAENASYFGGLFYMGLPAITFMMWKGMINTII